MSATDTRKAIEESQYLVGAIQVRDATTTEVYVWRLADLAAENTLKGRPRKVDADVHLFSVEDWAKEIGWLDQGNTVGYLQKLIQESRAWTRLLRVPGRTIEQHRDARAAHESVEEASAWLHSLKTLKNVRDRARNIGEVTGSGPVYEATLKLIRARKEVAGVSAKLAGSGILGNEANFPQFRRELQRLKNMVEFLDRYLADETVVDTDELDAALDRILSEEGAA